MARDILRGLCCAFALGCVDVVAQDVAIISTVALPSIEARDASHELRIAAFAFEGTRWDLAQARSGLAEAGRILARCGINVAIDLAVVRAPRRYHYLFTPDSRELLRNLKADRPALFLVEDTRNRPAYDAEAVGRSNSRSRPEMANTVWITHGTSDLPVAIAHELAHVLADSGDHTTDPGNLMNPDTAPGNTRLTPEQCAILIERGAAGGLIRARMVKP